MLTGSSSDTGEHDHKKTSAVLEQVIDVREFFRVSVWLRLNQLVLNITEAIDIPKTTSALKHTPHERQSSEKWLHPQIQGMTVALF